MIDELIFQRMHLLWPVIIGALCLWLLFIWKELEGRRDARFYMKIIAALIAVFSLAMLALQPSKKSLNNISQTVILSKDYLQTDLDSLKKAHRRLELIAYKPGMDLTDKVSSGQEVFVLGNGLKDFDLWQLDSTKVHFLPGSDPKGISQLKYLQEDVVGKEFQVKGIYSKGKKGAYLVLTGPGNIAIDSVELIGNNNQHFDLKGIHKVEGKYVYALVEKDSLGEVFSSSSLNVKVSSRKFLKVMVINQFPSFETKYLKNYLSEYGHEVVVRSQVSNDRYKYEYFNSDEKKPISLSSQNLKEIDLLVIDIPSLLKFSKETLQRIKTSISEQGLGLFIQTDETSFSSRIPLIDAEFKRHELKEVNFKSDLEISLSKHPYSFKENELLENIHIFDQTLVTAYKRLGRGRVGTTVLHNTYHLMLQGHTGTYQKLWSEIIGLISKRKVLDTSWKSDDIFVFLDQPFRFHVNSVNDEPKVESENGHMIPLKQHIDLNQMWSGSIYPQKLGWNQIFIDNDSSKVFDFYVQDTSQWTSLSAMSTRADNKRYSHLNKGVSSSYTSIKALPSWWFFLLFLVAMTVLWLEPKL